MGQGPKHSVCSRIPNSGFLIKLGLKKKKISSSAGVFGENVEVSTLFFPAFSLPSQKFLPAIWYGSFEALLLVESSCALPADLCFVFSLLPCSSLHILVPPPLAGLVHLSDLECFHFSIVNDGHCTHVYDTHI